MKHALALAAIAVAAAGCAGSENKPEAASRAAIATTAAPAANCVPPPGELVVKDLEEGKGEAVRFRTAVLAGYTGWLYDGCKPDFKGAVFDSSEGKPDISFMVGVGKMIRGWDEGAIGMKEGGKRLLIIPPDKAYGAAGAPGKIPPNSTLVFELQVDKIIAQPPQ